MIIMIMVTGIVFPELVVDVMKAAELVLAYFSQTRDMQEKVTE